eukprot:scaffold108059_cov55-Prasinocladus_malaysianus.AAC.1
MPVSMVTRYHNVRTLDAHSSFTFYEYHSADGLLAANNVRIDYGSLYSLMRHAKQVWMISKCKPVHNDCTGINTFIH